MEALRWEQLPPYRFSTAVLSEAVIIGTTLMNKAELHQREWSTSNQRTERSQVKLCPAAVWTLTMADVPSELEMVKNLHHHCSCGSHWPCWQDSRILKETGWLQRKTPLNFFNVSLPQGQGNKVHWPQAPGTWTFSLFGGHAPSHVLSTRTRWPLELVVDALSLLLIVQGAKVCLMMYKVCGTLI